ncbi:hypothetical protein KOR42_36970 [Thalassoglobus neptunius]|uniref:YHS domain protein n=1 Tax=Thalassoglobus neptunius TaxID=1938619 RepID=A0A5C5WJ20_9PLAN|nr:hypothetical protein [Thalassoglobus neptunius]TWT50013.1 hypothetical protein KOR42_36970 [Thalassoglobus neptunius]
MSRYRKLALETRALLLASATGAALLAPSLRTFAVDSATPGRLNTYQSSTETSAPSSSLVRERLQSLYGPQQQIQQTAGENRVQPIPVQAPRPLVAHNAQPIAQTAGTRETPKKRSFFDRLVSRFKGGGRVPSGPPQDPGMRYPKVSDSSSQYRSTQPQSLSQPATTPPPSMAPIAETTPGTTRQPLSFPRQSSPKTPVKPSGSPTANVPRPSGFIPPLPGEEFSNELTITKRSSQTTEKKTAEVKVAQKPVDSRSRAFEEVIEQAPEVSEFEQPIVRDDSSLPVLDLEALLADEQKVEAQMTVQVQPAAPEIDLPAPDQEPAATFPMDEEPVAATRSQSEAVADVPMPELNADLFFPGDVEESTVEQEQEVLVPEPEQAEFPEPEMNLGTTEVAGDSLGFFFEDEVPSPSPQLEQSPQQPSGEAAESNEFDWAQSDSEITEAEVTEETMEEPYTGLSLEDGLFVDLPLPAPADEEDSTELKEEPGFVRLDEVEEPEAEVPPQLELPPLFTADAKPEQPILKEEPTREEQQVVAQLEVSAPPLTPSAPTLTPSVKPTITPKLQPTPRSEARDSKKQKADLIKEREHLAGLKGFCPVALRDSRELLDTDDRYSAIFNNREYSFSTPHALESFLASPAKYAPALRGADVIHYALTGEEEEGSLDHAVWYKGRLYLFNSVETMETFVAAPSSHATNL